jgi:hypothetical protein
MLILVKTMAGQTLNLRVTPADFVADSKRMLEPLLHLMPQMMQLYFGSRLLEDSKTLQEIGVSEGSTLRVIGVRPGTAPLPASRARLLEMYIDTSTQAKVESKKEATARRSAFDAERKEQQMRADHVKLARDCGAKYSKADDELQRKMRAELLGAGYIEDPRQGDLTAMVVRQRDYLVRRAVAWIQKSGGSVPAFERELLEEIQLSRGAKKRQKDSIQESTPTHYPAELVEQASEEYQKASERLSLSAAQARRLRTDGEQARTELTELRSERDVLKYEAYSWKRDRRDCKARMKTLENTVATMTDELLHYRRKQEKRPTPGYTEVRAMFDAVDVDQSGTLDQIELRGLADSLLAPNMGTQQLSAAVAKMDRMDGVDFATFYDWFETELADAQLKHKPLYTEAKRLWEEVDPAAPGRLELGKLRGLVTTLLGPGLLSNGTSIGDSLRAMDIDADGSVDFHEFYAWYERQAERTSLQQQMETQAQDMQAQMLAQQQKMEVEAQARAETLAEEALFGMQANSSLASASEIGLDQDESVGESVGGVDRSDGSDSYEYTEGSASGSSGIFDDLDIDIGKPAAGGGAGSSAWDQLVHGEVDTEAATTNAAQKWKGKADAKKAQAEAKLAVEQMKGRLEADTSTREGRKKERESRKAKKTAQQGKTLVKLNLAKKIHVFCSHCGDSCTTSHFRHLNQDYCSEYCMCNENPHLADDGAMLDGSSLEQWRVA